MKLPRLYHLSKLKKIIEWDCWTEGSEIHVEYGEQDGKKQHTSKTATPKNVGKINATTAEAQAELEAQSMHKHRLDRKYSLTVEDAQEDVFLPMLAQEFSKKKNKIKYPVYVQPKLNGVRCLAHWDGDRIVLLSRSGKEYSVAHVAKVLELIIPKEFVFDGELYIHGKSLQDITSYVKKPKTESLELQYHIYDIFNPDDNTQFEVRKTLLACAGLDECFEEPLAIVETAIANNETEVSEALERYLSQGYEGAMIRLPEGLYELGHRSSNLLKLKKFKDAEFRIVGHKTGVGRFEKCVIWRCVQEEGREFDVVPTGTIEQKEEWAATAEQYYGKLLTVKFFDRTKDNIPQFPVGIAIRMEEDL